MKDWLDDLLSELPSEPVRPELQRSLERRLAAVRRAEVRRRRAWYGLRALAAAAGVWLLVPQLQPATRALPPLSYAGIGVWLRGLAASPPEAIAGTLRRTLDLESGIAGNLAPDVAVGLALLALPALSIVIALLGGQTQREASAA